MGVVWDGSRWAGFGVGQGGCGWVKGQDGRGGVGQGGQIWWCEALVGGGWGWVEIMWSRMALEVTILFHSSLL